MKTLVIIPTYNEVDNLAPICAELWSHSPESHVLVVDDNSTDGTRDVAETLLEEEPSRFFLIKRAGKLGLGTAYIAGFKWALENSYELIIEMDADFSHDPAMVPRMQGEARHGSQVVIGSRYTEGGGTQNWNWFRKLISRFGSFYAGTILNLRIRDLTGGFNAWRSEVLKSIDLDEVKSEGYCFQIELKYRAALQNFRIKEIPILFCERRAGQSKMSSSIVVEAMLRVWKLRFISRSPNSRFCLRAGT